MNPDTSDLAVEIVSRVFLAACKGEITHEQALEQVSHRELVETATSATPAILAGNLAMLHEAGQHRHTEIFAHLLTAVADALQAHQRPGSAVVLYNATEFVYRWLGLEVDAARCRMSRSAALQEMGRHAEAVQGYDAAQVIFARHGLEIDLARCQGNRASALQEMGRHAEAVQGYDAAQPIFARRGLEIEVAGCQMNRANTLDAMGRHAEAVKGYDAAQVIFSGYGLEIDVARCLMNRAGALQELGRHDEAVQGYDAAQVIFAGHGLEIEIAGCQMNRASALQELGRHEEASSGYDAAEPIFTRHGLEIDVARCQTNRANTLHHAGRFTEADECSRLVRAERLPPADRMRYHSVRGEVLFSLGRQDEAFEQFEQVRSLFREALCHGGFDERHLDFPASVRGIIREPVHLALRSGRVEWAFEAVQDAKACVAGELFHQLAARREQEPPHIAVLRKRMTDCLRGHFAQVARDPTVRQRQQTEEAIADFFRAWQSDVVGPSSRDLRQRMPPIGKRVPSADFENASVRAAIQQALPPGWVLLDFWEFDGREMKVFVLTRDRLRVETLANPWQHEEFRNLADAWLQAVHSVPGPGFDDGVLDWLDALLFAPLRQRGLLDGVCGLYLVPHDYLHQLPLHAARRQDERTHIRYLCDDFLISYLPSAALLPQLPPPDWHGTAISLANPEEGTWHTLPFAQWEGWQLQGRLPDGQIHIGKAATWSRALEWSNAGLVHFSCHGWGYPHFAPLSHLRLADDLLLAHDVLYRLPPLRPGALVVLNGCETGSRDLRAVDESMGLMTAFLLRGAGLVYATAWPVEDPLAAEMVLTFLAALEQPGTSPAEALRSAQQTGRCLSPETVEQRRRELLAQHFPEETSPHEAARLLKQGVCESLVWDARRYRKPLYWSAFHLVGRVT